MRCKSASFPTFVFLVLGLLFVSVLCCIFLSLSHELYARRYPASPGRSYTSNQKPSNVATCFPRSPPPQPALAGVAILHHSKVGSSAAHSHVKGQETVLASILHSALQQSWLGHCFFGRGHMPVCTRHPHSPSARGSGANSWYDPFFQVHYSMPLLYKVPSEGGQAKWVNQRGLFF